MAEDTGGVRVTQAQVYEKLLELQAIQIEMVAEIRGLKHLPEKVADLDSRLGKVELIAKLVYGVYGAILSAVAITLISKL